MRRLAIAAALAATLFQQPSEAAQVRVTYYLPTGSATASGVYPYSGSAACSYNFPMGSVVEFPNGDQYVCLDRGQLGATGWVDLFAWSHAEGRYMVATYGTYSDVSVVRWGW